MQLRCLAQELGVKKTDIKKWKGYRCCKYGRKGANLTVAVTVPCYLLFVHIREICG
jgi:hypothetical protein